MFSPATKDAANRTMSDASTAAGSAKKDLQTAGSNFGEDAANMARKAGAQVRETFDHASEGFSKASDYVTDEIRGSPVRSSALALGVGVILGLLLRRS
jgi:ElaB/YqjD/DUF883 family membrane-anchored ribosome-binding protein